MIRWFDLEWEDPTYIVKCHTLTDTDYSSFVSVKNNIIIHTWQSIELLKK